MSTGSLLRHCSGVRLALEREATGDALLDHVCIAQPVGLVVDDKCAATGLHCQQIDCAVEQRHFVAAEVNNELLLDLGDFAAATRFPSAAPQRRPNQPGPGRPPLPRRPTGRSLLPRWL